MTTTRFRQHQRAKACWYAIDRMIDDAKGLAAATAA
jgi:hypothetical protein